MGTSLFIYLQSIIHRIFIHSFIRRFTKFASEKFHHLELRVSILGTLNYYTLIQNNFSK